MMRRILLTTLLVFLAIAALSGCTSVDTYDYGLFLESDPVSILVLPPLDHSPEAGASLGCLSTVTRPLAERGYYVFPVALVDRMMRDNGLPTPYEMHSVSLSKLNEVFGADAVLYLTVEDWGTSYRILSSVTTVQITGRLVDTRSGEVIWAGGGSARRGSSGGGHLIGALVSAVVRQVATSISDPSRDVSRAASGSMIRSSHRGFLYGPYHPRYEADRKKKLDEREKKAKKKKESDGTPGDDAGSDDPDPDASGTNPQARS